MFHLRPFLFIFFLIVSGVTGVRAQTLKGNVVDGMTGKPLYLATVINMATQEATSTDELGRFSITAKGGTTISFRYVGYKTIERLATPSIEMHIELFPDNIQLKEFVLRDLTPYQKDSIELATLYSKELSKTRIKPTVGLNPGTGVAGIEADGLISSFAQKVSKSYKRTKRFKENFKKDEEQKFIDTRYKIDVVTAVTGLKGDTAVMFMNMYPMEYLFARAATDLELKMWIRDNYKDYLRRPQDGSAN